MYLISPNKNVFFTFFWITLICLFSACANIVPPSGGDKDTTPPKLLSINPADSQLNQKVRKIVLRFDEFVEVNNLATNMVLSPLLDIPPSVTVVGKKVEIKIIDSLLQDNTTYSISLGKAITDNREKTPFENFNYTFSTGNYFDSLIIKGQVYDALTGLPDTGISVQLYPEEFNDSLLFQKKPQYVAKTDAQGKFAFSSLPKRNFKLVALADLDGNRVFNREQEKIGFLGAIVSSQQADDSINAPIALRTSLMEKIALPNKVDTSLIKRNKYVGRVSSRAKNARAYQVMVDTNNLEKGSAELNQNLAIKLNAVLQNVDSGKILLTYQSSSGIEAEANTTLISDTTSLYLKTNWQPDHVYTLRLVKGWAVDTTGMELPPGRYNFRTKKTEDYSKLNVIIPDSLRAEKYLLAIFTEKDTLHFAPIKDSLISRSLLLPGTASMVIIVDDNNNGKWDPGNIFTKTQPEKIYHHESEITLKAAWEHDVDFKHSQPDPSAQKKKRLSSGNVEDKRENRFGRE